MPVVSGDLVIPCNADWHATMTYKVRGIPTQVDNPRAQIRRAPTQTDPGGQLLIDMVSTGTDPVITQSSPGVMDFDIPKEVTATFNDQTMYEWVWDFFGTVSGRRKKLAQRGCVRLELAETEL